jgi:hypothetical protein
MPQDVVAGLGRVLLGQRGELPGLRVAAGAEVQPADVVRQLPGQPDESATLAGAGPPLGVTWSAPVVVMGHGLLTCET